MASTPFITVIIPAFNAELYVAHAINSVLRQTDGRYEIIVVDDGSTDQTRDVVQRYGDLVRYEHQHNAGPSTARNRAIELATADMIACLDADDLWHPDKSAIQMARFHARPELTGCAAHVQNFLSDEGAIPPGSRDQHSMLQQTVVTLGST